MSTYSTPEAVRIGQDGSSIGSGYPRALPGWLPPRRLDAGGVQADQLGHVAADVLAVPVEPQPEITGEEHDRGVHLR